VQEAILVAVALVEVQGIILAEMAEMAAEAK
jgi:hypothetical protein